MPQPLSGPGLGLQLPQNLYPTELNQAPYDFATNKLGLAPGNSLVPPAGDWYIGGGNYCVLQYLDPVNNTWTTSPDEAWGGSIRFVKSDGFTVRVANMTACPIGAVVIASGTGCVQGSTTVTPTTGNSTWAAIVGGQVSITTVTNAGSGYGVAPLVFIPSPAPPSTNANSIGGLAASGYATISSGTVSGVTLLNPGAGYTGKSVNIAILPSPFDPNLTSTTAIVAATVTATVVGSGMVTGVLCTNSGSPVTTIANLTLTPGGSGSSVSVVPIMMSTVTAMSVTTAGAGYSTNTMLTTIGGVPSASGTYTDQNSALTAWRPRPAQIALTQIANTCVSGISAIYDGGLFTGTALPLVIAGVGASVAAVVTITQSSVNDYVILQPAP